MSFTPTTGPAANMPDSSADTSFSTGIYPSAIPIAIIALILSLLIFPPMIWHARNRNIGATSLIFWILILNIQITLNALIWRNSDTTSWWNGVGLCDIEVKIQAASKVGFPSSAACVLKALARVMDTNKVTLSTTNAQRRRSYAIDLLWCVGFPVLQMISNFIVQTGRYYIYGISGCVTVGSNSWVTDLLVVTPPVIWTLICAFYAVLVIVRLHRYRRNFTTLLAHSNTNKSRFMRLFCLCMAWLAISLPLEGYVLARQSRTTHEPFVWSEVHNATVWSKIKKGQPDDSVKMTRYIWLGAAVCVFLFFGWGRDATRMYSQALRTLGLARCFPALRVDHHRQASARASSVAKSMTSVSSKAKLMFARKSVSPTDSQETCATDSRSSNFTASAHAEPVSPKTASFLEKVHEEPRRSGDATEGRTRLSKWLRANTGPKFNRSTYNPEGSEQGIQMNNVAGRQVTGGRVAMPMSTKSFKTPPEVYVKKEVRVSSESV